MNRPRTLYLVAGLLSLTLCAVGVVAVYFTQTEAERAYGRIKVGMTLAEVEGVIGEPSELIDVRRDGAGIAYGWVWPSATLNVIFDDEGRVYSCDLHRGISLLDRLRLHLGW